MLLIILLLVSVLFIVISTSKFHFHPFLALLFAAVGFGLCARMPLGEIVNSINDGFGRTLGSIGIVIIAGVIIGTFLEHSGGAFRIAERILSMGHPAIMKVIAGQAAAPNTSINVILSKAIRLN